MKYIIGNLIELAKEGKFDVIVHGCNCFNTMGRGIARQIKSVFPGAYLADQITEKGSKSKLGDYSLAEIRINNKSLFIINAYTQYEYWNECDVDYEAIRECMKKINHNFINVKIGLPKIGAGLAGGDWNIIEKIITEELRNNDVTIVTLN